MTTDLDGTRLDPVHNPWLLYWLLEHHPRDRFGRVDRDRVIPAEQVLDHLLTHLYQVLRTSARPVVTPEGLRVEVDYRNPWGITCRWGGTSDSMVDQPLDLTAAELVAPIRALLVADDPPTRPCRPVQPQAVAPAPATADPRHWPITPPLAARSRAAKTRRAPSPTSDRTAPVQLSLFRSLP